MARLTLNYQDLLAPELDVERLKMLQGSSIEMHAFLQLPEMLREAVRISITNAELKQKQKEEKERNAT